MYNMTFLLQPPPAPPRLIIFIQDGIVQPRFGICVARWAHKKRKIAVKSIDNVAERRTNDGGLGKG